MSIRRHWKKLLIITLALLIAAAGLIGYRTYVMADQAVQSVTKSGSIADLLKPEALNGESTGVVNVLIAGNSAADPNHGGALLTDSIIVASYNLSAKQLTLISIPRDLYVNVNGNYMKINAAYTNGGMDTLKAVVEKVTGLTINHQVLVDYAAVRDMIDAVGGIDINIGSSDPRGIYDPMVGFSIGNGVQHLTGDQALLLARSRNDPTYDGRIPYGLPNGDFDRQANQRKIIEALLGKIASSATLVNSTELQSMISSLSGNVSSDFTVGQLRRAYDLSKEVATTHSITIRGVDGNILLRDYKTVADGDALIPAGGIGSYSAIQAYINRTISAQPAASTSAGSTP